MPRLEFLTDDGEVAVPSTWRWTVGAFRQWMACRQAVEAARDEGATSLLLVEDDCEFHESFDAVAAAFHRDHPLPDLLYYGSDITAAQIKAVGQGVVGGSGILLAHCVSLHRNTFDAILAAEPQFPWDCDLHRLIQSDARRRCLALRPSVARSRPGYSHVYEQIVNYNSYLEGDHGPQAKSHRQHRSRSRTPHRGTDPR